MNKFTPGPWHSQLDGSDWGMPRNHAILSDGGELIAEIHSIQPYCAGESKKNIDRVMRDMANARLIAAAPTLYKALNEAHSALIVANGCKLTIKKIEAALEAAERSK